MTGDALGELAEIRRDLREMRWYVEDAELRTRVTDWIDESHETSDADTAREFVERELNAHLANFEMYHAPHLARGEDGFPDACKDCRHYGSSCPVLLDDVEVRWRERKLEQADTEQEARRVYQQAAIDVSCQRIPELLEEWDSRHGEFVRQGQQLVSAVEDALREDGKAVDEAEEALGTALADGGTE